MPEPHDLSQLPDEASLRIEAPAERIYELVSDITQMGRLSPECTGGRWLDGATGPEVGARFKGTNKRGFVRWSTTNTVVRAEPGRAFAFDTKQSGTRWTYELEPDGDATVVTERREEVAPRPLVAKVAATLLMGGIQSHDDEMRQGLQATLERLKSVAESP
ncbi:MAG: SRPBCC family protein [Acidimicrobiales bacterium]